MKAIDAATWSVSSNEPQALTKHQSARFGSMFVGCIPWAAGSFATFVVTALTIKTLAIHKPFAPLLLLGVLFVGMILSVLGAARNARQMSPAELEAVLPVLDLNETGRAYAETVAALHRSGSPKADVDETMGALNALLDEENRLTTLRERLAGRGEENGLAALETEGDALRARLATTADPLARDAYSQSLGLLEERLAAFRSGDVGLERVDAHLSLLRQAVLATRDAARRLDAAPSSVGTDLATDSLRAAVSHARIQTQATEQALAELRAI